MEIVHVYDGHERVHDGRGSVPNVLWNVARETAAAGHDVTVLERQWDGLPARASHEGVRFERFDLSTGADEPWERVPYELVESPVGLARLVGDRTNFARAAFFRLRDLDPDVIHVHLPFAASVLATVAPWLRDRLVYTAHLGELRLDALTDDQQGAAAADGGTVEVGEDAASGDDETGGLDAPDVLSLASPDTFLANRVAHTTVLNPDVADVFADRGVPRDRLTVVPNGVDVDRFGDVPAERQREVRRAYDLDDSPVVLFVGTVMPRKGVDDLVRATERLVAEHGYEDLQVVVAGEDDLDGEYTAEVRELAAEAGVADVVRFAGFVPGEDLPALYALADVFALPSREEGFGMTVTEALAAGTPTVATDVGGIPRLVDEGEQGSLVSPNDPDGLAAGIDRVLSVEGDERSRMADRARERAAEYSWRGVARQFCTIYEEVAR
ncbi:glycosyltransferase family 4 protein [Halorientalis halophila]|uniref:glycosyltransferase family 4 protein n=1 Tax=Halorientalis halophila TaxID=3108499 RepID=UPI003008961E